MRLENGSQPYEGRVEICFDETWGTICDRVSYSYQPQAYHIICKQLGYSGAGILGHITISMLVIYYTIMLVIYYYYCTLPQLIPHTILEEQLHLHA